MADQTSNNPEFSKNPNPGERRAGNSRDNITGPWRPIGAEGDDLRDDSAHDDTASHADIASIETGAIGNANNAGMAGTDKLNAYIPAESSLPFTPANPGEGVVEPEAKPNLDPLTGEPGAHPIGAGVGAAGGGLVAGTATGIAIGSIAGPIGQALGAAAGAIIGGLAGGYAGRGVAETIHPTLGGRRRRSPSLG